MNYIIFRRFGLFLITLLLFTSCSHSMPPKRQRAWIDERFADSIIHHSTIDGNLLFPIVGFEEQDDTLYILTYGGELEIVQRERGNEYVINDFVALINTQTWPEKYLEIYKYAVVRCIKENENITVTFDISGEKYQYKFISVIDDCRFSTILEIQGWLFNYFIPSAFDN